MTGHEQAIEVYDWTAVHKVKRRLYRIHDVQLPVPVSFVQAAAAVAVLLLTRLLLTTLTVPLTARTSPLYLAPALAAGFAAGREAMEGGRTFVQWSRARVRWALLPAAVVVG